MLILSNSFLGTTNVNIIILHNVSGSAKFSILISYTSLTCNHFSSTLNSSIKSPLVLQTLNCGQPDSSVHLSHSTVVTDLIQTLVPNSLFKTLTAISRKISV